MKKIAMFALFFVFLSVLEASSADLYWFVSAAIKKPTNKIAYMFNKTHKDKVVVIPGGTGQILQQMIMSQKGDIYGCVDEKFFKMAQSKGLAVRYIKFLKLTPVFGISSNAAARIKNFDDLLRKNTQIAAGNPKTMALGKTYMHILHKLPGKIQKKLKNSVKIEAVNISQIISYIKMNTVDAGILFGAVARVNHIKYISIPKQYNRIKTGYLAEMIFGKNEKAKNKLFNFILKHLNIYKQYGFQVIYR